MTPLCRLRHGEVATPQAACCYNLRMSDPHTPPCEQSCTASCAATCPSSSPGIPLPEAIERFGREATQGSCDTGRYRCRYFTWGSGPPLVFLHGLADTSRAFILPSALLARSFQCIAYDLPDGSDGADLKRYTHADMVADLFALLDHLGVKQSYVFGVETG